MNGVSSQLGWCKQASVAGSVAGSARALSDDDSSIGDDEQLEELRAELSEAIGERERVLFCEPSRSLLGAF